MSEAHHFLAREDLQVLLDALREKGYRCIGPVVHDGAVVFDEIRSVEQLPRGLRQVQGPGHYRQEETGGERLFAWANGPQGLKPWLFPPREILWACRRGDDGRLHFEETAAEAEPLAVIGARPCDIAALYIHDRHFRHGPRADPRYRARRLGLFMVAVNCTHPAETCFCASTGDGPEATYGYDLALTELDDGFVVRVHTQRGEELLQGLAVAPAGAEREAAATEALRAAAQGQSRRLPGRDLRAPLQSRLGAEHWQAVGERCLACGNCTSVCPTCFCHRHGVAGDLDLDTERMERAWDSCFTQEHSYIHGLTLRPDTASRYRQWLVHKLATWHDQYGRSGCVGCGRCITWCPVGIDITEEAARLCAGGHD